MEYFETTNRKLEQFLYYHKIYYTSLRKNEHNLTTWAYEKTPFLTEILAEFQKIYQEPEKTC